MTGFPQSVAAVAHAVSVGKLVNGALDPGADRVAGLPVGGLLLGADAELQVAEFSRGKRAVRALSALVVHRHRVRTGQGRHWLLVNQATISGAAAGEHVGQGACQPAAPPTTAPSHLAISTRPSRPRHNSSGRRLLWMAPPAGRREQLLPADQLAWLGPAVITKRPAASKYRTMAVRVMPTGAWWVAAFMRGWLASDVRRHDVVRDWSEWDPTGCQRVTRAVRLIALSNYRLGLPGAQRHLQATDCRL